MQDLEKRPVRKALIGLAAAVSCLSATAGALAAPAPALPNATLASTREFAFESAINHEAYRVQVFIPRAAPQPQGFPVLYVLDGNALFGSFANAVRNRSQVGELVPAVVVGISSGDGPRGADRTLDFTTVDMTAQEKALIRELGPDAPFGGAEAFRNVILGEIAPRVAQIVPVDPHRRILFGWSLGGLFVVHTMLAHPDDFATYLALSPSIWRGNGATEREIPGFEGALAASHARVRLFVGAGGHEQDPASRPVGNVTQDEWARELTYAHTVDRVRALGERLAPTLGAHRGDLEIRVFDQDTHNSVPWTALNPMLDFALTNPER